MSMFTALETDSIGCAHFQQSPTETPKSSVSEISHRLVALEMLIMLINMHKSSYLIPHIISLSDRTLESPTTKMERVPKRRMKGGQQ